MTHHKKIIAAILFLLAKITVAEENAIQEYVASIRSVEQVKAAIRTAISAECASGVCANNNATEICALVGAIDIRLDGLVTNNNARYKSKPEFSVSGLDVQLFKMIWKQCKPTNYQFWNFGSVLHVWYEPNPRDDAEIRRALGLSAESKDTYSLPSSPPNSINQPVAPLVMLVPLEPNAVILEEHRGNISLFNDLVRIVRSKGYRCDSISTMRPFFTSRGFVLVCNRHDYRYEIEDKGGIWQVSIK